MAKMLFKEGKVRILSDDLSKLNKNQANQLIKTAGTTCYQTRETSKKSPEDFIKMIQVSGHYAMLEHSWWTIEMQFLSFSLMLINERKKIAGYNLYQANNLFCISEREESLLISGNARMLNEAFAKEPNDIFVASLFSLMSKINPVLFPEKIDFYIDKTFTLIFNPKLLSTKETLIHRAMTVEFSDNSRGMTHETVRSRNGDKKITSYAQESTRYVDYAKGEVDLEKFQIRFILPYNDQFNFENNFVFSANGKIYSFTPQEFTNLLEAWYRTLRKNGLKPEEARQWLPIGIKSQIVQTYNLNEWRHWFFIRTSSRAHPEIRFLAVKLLQEMQKRIPECFNDFEIKEGYAVYQDVDILV